MAAQPHRLERRPLFQRRRRRPRRRALADRRHRRRHGAGGGSLSGPAGSLPQFLEAGGTLYLSADDGVHGRELWKTDGTAAGTAARRRHQARDRPARTRASGSTSAAASCCSTPTTASTAASPGSPTAPPPGPPCSPTSIPGAGDSSIAIPSYNSENDVLALGGGAFLFPADDGVHGPELWKSDGTAAGTALWSRTSIPAADASIPTASPAWASQILFAAYQAATGIELWPTDGTAAGTVRLNDINPGTGSEHRQRSSPRSAARPSSSADDGSTGLRALEDGRHRGRHRSGEGHQPRRGVRYQHLHPPDRSRLSTAARSSSPTTAPTAPSSGRPTARPPAPHGEGRPAGLGLGDRPRLSPASRWSAVRPSSAGSPRLTATRSGRPTAPPPARSR